MTVSNGAWTKSLHLQENAFYLDIQWKKKKKTVLRVMKHWNKGIPNLL